MGGQRGSLHGSPRNLAQIVLGDDPVAIDSICNYLMGLDPLRMIHLASA